MPCRQNAKHGGEGHDAVFIGRHRSSDSTLDRLALCDERTLTRELSERHRFKRSGNLIFGPGECISGQRALQRSAVRLRGKRENGRLRNGLHR